MHLMMTCEHGGNQVPLHWKSCFKKADAALASHRGYDRGALELAEFLSSQLSSPLVFSTTTRLLVELNRSLHHPHLFSKWTQHLSKEEKEMLLQEYYLPYRLQVEKELLKKMQRGPVLHLSVHSFTPALDGIKREGEIGLLYDSRRKKEKVFATQWKQSLQKKLNGEMRIRMNYPYLGKADGLTSFLRKKWGDETYLGIELEVNQGLVDYKSKWKSLKESLLFSLRQVLELN
ncbi:N-formylglutamate amidohydrolase [Parachlamydia acanthamoebae]|uniref:N-formylglutamate amidohydrolase n=1 Tax=Parachlamydia acanthamoebae TaxID=83552 RepID=UPI0007511E70|nr:N-formylglutamate amidohydrolase [Parachlamydia acanthamoebae]